jgi:transcriptional regulator GlxA family with amidase domain
VRDGSDHGRAVLRRAVAHIEQHHADPNLTMADIAAAARATPRTVQYAFRSRLDTTPMNYLRRVRLARAHEDLRRADPASTTVTAVAARWGFLHPGRFAFYYRQAYRETPSATLHSR